MTHSANQGNSKKKFRILAASGCDRIFIPALREFEKIVSGEVTDFFPGHASADLTPNLTTYFPNVVVHSLSAATKGTLGVRKKGESYPQIDAEILNRYARHERVFHQMLDFSDPYGIGFESRERREHYYSVLRYILWILENRRPDVVIFGLVPHSNYDVLLFLICEDLGIKCIFLQSIFIPGYVLACHSIQNGNLRLPTSYRNLMNRPPDQQMDQWPDAVIHYFKGLRKDYSLARPDHMAEFLRDTRKGILYDWFTKILPNPFFKGNYSRVYIYHSLRILKAALRVLVRPLKYGAEYFVRETGEPYKRPGKRFEADKTTVFHTEWVRVKNFFFQKKLRKAYDRLGVKLDLKKKYVYFPLHYQPEATTYPLGLQSIDLSLPIRMLSEAIPDDWEIYVREHPCTFSPGSNRGGFFGRELDYYENLLKIPKVRIAAMDMDPFQLTDSALAVATLTGRPAWEACNRGIPGLVFGAAWYRGCEGVYSISSNETLRTAIDEIIQGVKPNPKNIETFISAVLENTGYFNIYGDLPYAKLSEAESSEAMAKLFAREFLYLLNEGRNQKNFSNESVVHFGPEAG